VTDPARWGEQGRERPALVEMLQTAVVGRRKVGLVYANVAGERTQRVVDLWGLAEKDAIWYLLAGTDDGQRTFRIDRVIDAVEHHRSLVSATVLIRAELLPVLRTQFGRHCAVDSPLGDGRIRVRLSAPMAVMIAEHLAGWGAHLEVVEPTSVRTELARIGTELTQRYPT
jgi:predicted DNA-binding transcriptional regulator YafY